MKNITTVLFDLDGTLLPMDRDAFEKAYVGSFAQYNADVISPQDLLTALMGATDSMIENQEKTAVNEVRFYEHFKSYMDADTFAAIDAKLDHYYSVEFDVVKAVTSQSQAMVDSVAYLKESGKQLILATNPLFPKVATDKRIAWSGVDLTDFMDVTRFEENHFCKPQLQYYTEILEDHGLKAEECLMVGNDVEEDLIARELGMKTMLLTDDLIYRNTDTPIECDWSGTRQEFLQKIKELF